MRRIIAASALVVAVIAVFGRPADAADGDPDFTGGQLVAPYTGNTEPAIASNGTDALVVWTRHDAQSGRDDIYGRITSTATTTIGSPFRISTGTASTREPDVAWSGSAWLVVWEVPGVGDIDVRGRRVSGEGQLLGSQQLAIATGSRIAFSPKVAGGKDGQYLVAWTYRATSGSDGNVFARRVTSAGGLLDGGGIQITYDSDTPGFAPSDDDVAVAWNGQRYALVWEARYQGTLQSLQIHGGSVLTNGAATFHGTVAAGASDGTRTYDVSAPSIAASGSTFFLVWLYEDPGFSGTPKVHGGVWKPGVDSPPDDRLSTAAGEQSEPTVAGNGSFMVVWGDRRNGEEDLWGARVAVDGTLRDPDGFLVTEYYPANRRPALTRGSSARETFTIAWEATPGGQGPGVVAYGLRPAPK